MHLLLRTTHDMALALQRCSSLHCLLLDFTKALNSVPHERLLLKLDAIGIRGKLLAWIHDFFTCPVQRVVVNGSYYSCLPVRSAGICSWPPAFSSFVTGFEKRRLPCTQQQDTLFTIKR